MKYRNFRASLIEDLKDYESACRCSEKAVAILQSLFPNGHPKLDMYKRNLEKIETSRRKAE